MAQRTCQLRGEEIHRLRRLKSLTLARLAKATGVDLKTLKRWIKGEEAFFDNVRRLAETLGTSIQNLKQGLEPVYSGVQPAPTNVFNMTFSVSLSEAPSPEGIKRLCDFLSEAVARFESLSTWHVSTKTHINKFGIDTKQIAGDLPVEDEISDREIENPIRAITSMEQNRKSEYRVDCLSHQNWSVYYITLANNTIAELAHVFQKAAIVLVAEGEPDPNVINSIRIQYLVDTWFTPVVE